MPPYAAAGFSSRSAAQALTSLVHERDGRCGREHVRLEKAAVHARLGRGLGDLDLVPAGVDQRIGEGVEMDVDRALQHLSLIHI